MKKTIEEIRNELIKACKLAKIMDYTVIQRGPAQTIGPIEQTKCGCVLELWREEVHRNSKQYLPSLTREHFGWTHREHVSFCAGFDGHKYRIEDATDVNDPMPDPKDFDFNYDKELYELGVELRHKLIRKKMWVGLFRFPSLRGPREFRRRNLKLVEPIQVLGRVRESEGRHHVKVNCPNYHGWLTYSFQLLDQP